MSIVEGDEEEEEENQERESSSSSSSTSMETTIPYLPDLIVLDILSRLPVKSIMRFKSSCKRWHNLISTRHFLKTHLARSRRRVAILEPRCPPSALALRLIDFEPNSDHHHQDPSSSIDLHNSFKYTYPDAKILCSYDGLLLVSISEKTLFVWNPSIRQYKHVNFHYFLDTVHTIAGIGYDSIADEYKLVMAYQVTRGTNCNQTLANCVSLETKSSSRNVKPLFPYRILEDSSGTVVDGCPYFIVTRERVNFSVVICYDIIEDIFIELEQPDCIFDDSQPNSLFDLAVLRGLLCLVCHKTSHVEVWALDRSDVIESWYNFFVIPNNPETLSFCYLKPLSFTQSGDVLLEVNRNSLVVYNLEKGTWRLAEYHQNYNRFKVAMYAESLISPHGVNGSRHQKITYIPTRELPLLLVPWPIQRKELHE